MAWNVNNYSVIAGIWCRFSSQTFIENTVATFLHKVQRGIPGFFFILGILMKELLVLGTDLNCEGDILGNCEKGFIANLKVK